MNKVNKVHVNLVLLVRENRAYLILKVDYQKYLKTLSPHHLKMKMIRIKVKVLFRIV